MKVIVSGAGIGGLTAAIALAREGHQVRVLEKAPRPKPVGAGISMQPNALFAFGTLGIDKAVMNKAYASPSAHLRYSSGKTIRRFDFRSYQQRYGYVPHTIHRADLFDVLHESATALGVDVDFGQEFVSFDEVEHEVRVTSGRDQFVGDALIGADGINSVVRSQLWGDSPTRYSGYVCWRGIVSEPSIVQAVTDINEVWGRAARCGFMRCSPDKVYWYVARTSRNQERPDPSWRDYFRDWPAPISDLLDATPDQQTAFNDISDRKPIFPWGKGRVTLLGDAAHPMTPNFGQGGAQAIEDAVVIAKAIGSEANGSDGNPARAFRRYENHRQNRTASMVRASRSFGAITQGGSLMARIVRDHILTWIPESMADKKLDDQLDAKPHLALQNDIIATSKSSAAL